MSNASDVAFLFDSDALIQIFLVGQHQVFQILETGFGVRSYLMSEVEVEIRSNKKFGGLIKPRLDKTLKAKSLKLLGSSDLDRLAPEGSSPLSLSDIRELGKDYALDVGTGEAYTHAAGVLLNTPVVSNDMNAIRTLIAKGKQLPPTVLRSFDLFGFLHLEQYLKGNAAEQVLKELKAQNEWMPQSMRNSSFEDGIKTMNCRLSTSLSVTASGVSWSDSFYLKRVTDEAKD